jgi:hypothetical protein
MMNIEYYVPSPELGKEFSQIMGILGKCLLVCEHYTAIHREQHLFSMVEMYESGEMTRGRGTI